MVGKKGMKHYPLELKQESMRMFHEEGKTSHNGITFSRILAASARIVNES